MAEAPSDIESLSVTGMSFCEFIPPLDNWQHEQMLGATYARNTTTKMLSDKMLHDIGVVNMMECYTMISVVRYQLFFIFVLCSSLFDQNKNLKSVRKLEFRGLRVLLYWPLDWGSYLTYKDTLWEMVINCVISHHWSGLSVNKD